MHKGLREIFVCGGNFAGFGNVRESSITENGSSGRWALSRVSPGAWPRTLGESGQSEILLHQNSVGKIQQPPILTILPRYCSRITSRKLTAVSGIAKVAIRAIVERYLKVCESRISPGLPVLTRTKTNLLTKFIELAEL